MLPRPALRLIPRQQVSWCWRANPTFRSIYSAQQKASSIARPHRISDRRPNTDSVYIRTWDRLQSLVEVYAIIRAVERKYGRVREFRLWRDEERPESFQSMIWAVFTSPESLKLVPEDAEIMHIPVRPMKSTPPGGIGLDELQGLLEPQERSKEVELPEWRSVMNRVLEDGEKNDNGEAPKKELDIRIERAARSWNLPSDADFQRPSYPRLRAGGFAFLDWGGFYNLKPLSSSPYISQRNSPPQTDNSLSTQPTPPPEIDHKRMRMALTKWSNFVGRPDPSISVVSEESSVGAAPTEPTSISEPTESDFVRTNKDDTIEWDPIPDRTSSGIAGINNKVTTGDLEIEAGSDRPHKPEGLESKGRDH